jgi:sn-glycerol 3-phosphate transport system permease protein
MRKTMLTEDRPLLVRSYTSESPAGDEPKQKTRYFVHAALIGISIFLALPLIYALVVATRTGAASYRPPSELLPPGGDFFNNIVTLFEERGFDHFITNTVVVTMVVMVGKTIFSMLAGLAFVFFRFPGKWVLFFLILLTLLLPTEIILLPLYNLVADLQWGSEYPQLALTVPFLASAAGAFLFRQHFNNIPRELVEAAQIDGATPLRFLWAVLLPMSLNVIVAHCVLQFISMWNQYLWPQLVIQNSEDQLIQQGVRRVAGFSTQTDYGMLMTAGIVASIPPLIIFILLQKPFMSGFSLTRDK